METWRDSRGEVCAYAYQRGARFLMDWPSVARFSFDTAGATVMAWPSADADASTIARVHRRAVVPAAMQCLGYEVLHAGAVRLDSGVAGFCGDPEAGKSTMAFALARRGFDQWSDDSLVLDVQADGVQAVPIPFDAALRPASARHLAGQAGGTLEGQVVTAPGGRAALAALVLLERQPAGPDAGAPTLAPLSPQDAFQRVLPHACAFSLKLPGRRRTLISNYLALVSRTPVYVLRYPSGFEALEAAIDVVLGVVAGAGRQAAGAAR